MGEVNVTRHGEKRTRQRLGVKKKNVGRAAEKALTFGVTHAEAKGSLSRYLDGLYLSHGRANNMRVYNRCVYLFHGSSLITVLNLPRKYITQADKLQRQKENAAHQPKSECASTLSCANETHPL